MFRAFKAFPVRLLTLLIALSSTLAQLEVPPPPEITLQTTTEHLHLNRSLLPENFPKGNKVLSGIPIPTGISLPTFSPITLTETSTRSFLDELNLININNNKQLSIQNQASSAGSQNSPFQSGQSFGNSGSGSYGGGNALSQPSVPVFNQQPTSGNFGNSPTAYNNGQNFQGQSGNGFGTNTGNNQQQQNGFGTNTGNIQQQQQQPQQTQSSGYSGGANFGGSVNPQGQFGQSFSPSPASNTQYGGMNQDSSYGGSLDQVQNQNSYGSMTAQNNVQPGSYGSSPSGFPVMSSGQYSAGGGGTQQSIQNSGAGQSYSGGAPASLPVGQNGNVVSGSSGSYSGGSPVQNGLQNGLQNGVQNGLQNSGLQAPLTGFTGAPIPIQPITLPLTGFTAAPVTPSAAFNQIQGSNQLASGFASSLPAAINSGGQNSGPSSNLNSGNNLQSQNFNNQLGNNQQQTQSSYGGSSGNAQLPVVQQQQSSYSSGQPQSPQIQQPLEPSGYGIGSPSSIGQSGYGNNVNQQVSQPQSQQQQQQPAVQSSYGSPPQGIANSYNSPPAQGSAVQSYGPSFPQGNAYGGPGTAQLNSMVGYQQPSYGNTNNQISNNRPNSIGTGSVPSNGGGSVNSGNSGFGNQGGFGVGSQGGNQNFGGSSTGNGGGFGSGNNNIGQSGLNNGFAASLPNGQGLQGTSQSLFNNQNQQGISNLQNQNQNQNLITTTPFSGFGGLASLAASIQQQLGRPTSVNSGIDNAIGATPSPAISPNQVQQQQQQQQNGQQVPQQVQQQQQLNNQQQTNQQLTNQQNFSPINSNQNQPNGGLSGNQANQQAFSPTNTNQNQPVNGLGSLGGNVGNQINQQNSNQLGQVPQNVGGLGGSQQYG